MGRAHSRGRWKKLDLGPTDYRRGGFVTHTSPKLDNPVPRRLPKSYVAKGLASDTFRESQAPKDRAYDGHQ